MTKIKNRILIVLALVMLCAVGVFALAACNNTETYTVTFMVREKGTTGDWQQYTTVDTNDDGSVTLPAEPTVDGYTFRDYTCSLPEAPSRWTTIRPVRPTCWSHGCTS